MKRSILSCKVLHLGLVFLFLFISAAHAETSLGLAPNFSNDSQLEGEMADLSPLYLQASTESKALNGIQYNLYALNDGAYKTKESYAQHRTTGHALEKWHKYLGYGTVLLAALTAATNSNESLHESLAYVTAGGSISTVSTGYLAHRDRFGAGQGLMSKDNLHIALGTLGAAVLTTAVAIADDGEESSHSSLGVAGGVLMTLGVIEIKW